MDISLTNIVKSYPRAERPALGVAGLTLKGGRVHGILGHSGSGKSTMLNLLSLLDRPDSGNGDGSNCSILFHPGGAEAAGFRWAGKRAKTEDGIRDENRWRLDHYSFVFQAGYLLENFNVLDNVLMPLRLKGRLTHESKQRAKDKLTELGLGPDKWKALPRHLSGGECQRVAVARSIVHEPHVLFADEPTGSLDPGLGEKVMEALVVWKNERPDSNLLLLVTHNPDHVEKYCDSVTVLSGGEVMVAVERSRKPESEGWGSWRGAVGEGADREMDFKEIRGAMSGALKTSSN